MAFSWFGGNKNKNKKKNAEEKQPLTEDSDSDNDMQWFDDIIDGANSDKGGKQILTKLWEQISGENMISRLRTPKQRSAATIWGTLCHRCEVSYPPRNELKPINMHDSKRLINELKYAVRHAIAAYPPIFICVMGLKADVAYAFKSNKKILKSAFKIEEKDVIIDNCSNNLILPNATHEPAFYLCVDHEQSKIIVSIRGSSSLADALTDVNAVSKEYCAYDVDGFVHEGIMAATRFVFDKVTDELINVCKKYKNYQVIITGHSLGAGVSACLGFMYKDHPVIRKQNNLQVYAFASPPVVSKGYIDKKIGEDYITTVALTTDVVTRLSLESMKKQNRRLDTIMLCDKNTIKNLITDLKDDEKDNNETDGKETDNTLNLECTFIKCEHDKKRNTYTYTLELKNNNTTWTIVKRYNEFNKFNNFLKTLIKSNEIELPKFPEKQMVISEDGKKQVAEERMDKLATYMKYVISNKIILDIPVVRNFLDIPVPMKQSLKLLNMLKNTETPNPQDQLFPLGKILWFVPQCCMDEDCVKRRKTLMCLKEDSTENDDELKDENDGQLIKKGKTKYATTKTNSLSSVWTNTWQNLTKGFEEFQDLMDNPLITGGAKLAKKYDGSHYILCDGTECREMFQEMVLELPESLASHMPNRYIWALDAHLTRGNLYDDTD